MMIYVLLMLMVFGLLVYPKLTICIFIVISTIIPATHGASAYKLQLIGFNVSYTDLFILVFFLSSVIRSIIQRKSTITLDPINKAVLGLIVISSFYLIIGILMYKDLSQSFYDSRVVFYYSLLLINFNGFLTKNDFTTIIYVFLTSLALYSILCFTMFMGFDNHPYAIFFLEDDFISFGRIGFQQDYLFLIALPYVLYLIKNRRNKSNVILYLLGTIYITKVILGMSRGLSIFILLSMFFVIWNNNFKIRTIKRSFLVGLFKFIIIIASFGFTITNYIMPLIFKDQSSTVMAYLASRYTAAFATDNTSFVAAHVDNRLLMWKQGISEIFSSVFLGRGYGYTFIIDHSEWVSKPLSFIDSSFVTIILRSGILAFISLFIIYYNQRIIVKKSILRSNEVIDGLFLRTLYSSIPILMIFAILNSYMVFSTSIFPLILIFSIINSIYRSKFDT